MALLSQARRQGMRAMVHPDARDTPLFESNLDMLERSSLAQFAAQINALLNRPSTSKCTTRCPVPSCASSNAAVT